MIDEEKSKVYLKSSSVWDRFRLMFFLFITTIKASLHTSTDSTGKNQLQYVKERKRGITALKCSPNSERN